MPVSIREIVERHKREKVRRIAEEIKRRHEKEKEYIIIKKDNSYYEMPIDELPILKEIDVETYNEIITLKSLPEEVPVKRIDEKPYISGDNYLIPVMGKKDFNEYFELAKELGLAGIRYSVKIPMTDIAFVFSDKDIHIGKIVMPEKINKQLKTIVKKNISATTDNFTIGTITGYFVKPVRVKTKKGIKIKNKRIPFAIPLNVNIEDLVIDGIEPTIRKTIKRLKIPDIIDVMKVIG